MKYAEIIKEALTSDLSREKSEMLIEAIVMYYADAIQMMKSGDPSMKEAVLREGKEIQTLLAAKKDFLSQKVDLTKITDKENPALMEAQAKLANILEPRPKRKPRRDYIPV